jgi:hypothetical protein
MGSRTNKGASAGSAPAVLGSCDLLDVFLWALVVVEVVVAPYAKVEEEAVLRAVHDLFFQSWRKPQSVWHLAWSLPSVQHGGGPARLLVLGCGVPGSCAALVRGAPRVLVAHPTVVRPSRLCWQEGHRPVFGSASACAASVERVV